MLSWEFANKTTFMCKNLDSPYQKVKNSITIKTEKNLLDYQRKYLMKFITSKDSTGWPYQKEYLIKLIICKAFTITRSEEAFWGLLWKDNTWTPFLKFIASITISATSLIEISSSSSTVKENIETWYEECNLCKTK